MIDFRPIAEEIRACILAADLGPHDEVILIHRMIDADGRPAEPLRRSLTHASRHMMPWLTTIPHEVAAIAYRAVMFSPQAPICWRPRDVVRVVDYSIEVMRHDAAG